MGTYKTVGLVLRRTDLGEADRIITFLTPDRGKLRAVARGVRRAKSRLGGHLELFSEVELMVAEGRNLDKVASARLQRHFGAMVEDYTRLAYGYLFAEILDRLLEEGTALPEPFELTRTVWSELDAGRTGALLELFFKLRLLAALGYAPELSACAVCRRPANQDEEYFFNLGQGGIVDRACSGAGDSAFGARQIKLWRLILDWPVGRVGQIGDASGEAGTSLAVCDRFYDYIFGKRFKAAGLLAGRRD